MVLLRMKDITKMDEKEVNSRIKELTLELIKANVTANRASAKTKEIKRAISRLNTFSKSQDLLKKR